jgi:hypothetical protein
MLSAPAQAYDGPWPLVFDWTVSPEWGAVNPTPISTQTLPSGFHANVEAITPLPKPSYYSMMKEDSRFATLFQQLQAQNRPKGFLLGSDTSPLYGLRDPGTLSYMLNQFHTNNRKLDYVFVEYEPQFAPDKVQETNATVTAIRSHSNPLINQAMIGEYDVYPISDMRFNWYPGLNTQARIDQMNGLYNSAGLNVAMPSLYPNEAYELHAGSTYWPVAQRSPNKRSALFYGPLELFSNVKLNLPLGHKLIPYLSDFFHMDGFNADPPPREDNAALVSHIRLRGADGYYGFYVNQNHGDQSAVKNEEFKADAANSWTSLDWLFEGAEDVPTILNLNTNKRFGIEWSGVATENGVAIIVSNLGNSATTFVVPSISGYPEYDALLPDTMQLPAGTHQLIFAQVPEPASALSMGLAFTCLLARRIKR